MARAAELSLETVCAHARYRKHVNGWVLVPNEALMSQGVDKTEELREAARTL